jgi:predicted DNA-binding transcriptional regulator YafY
MRGDTRLNCVVHSLRALEFVSRPGWHTRKALALALGVTRRTATRWVVALERAGVPLEFNEENTLFRKMRR